MPSSRSRTVHEWTCAVCRKTTSVTHDKEPVGWAWIAMRFSSGGDEDYDDCRRMGYREFRDRQLCGDCGAAVDALLKAREPGYRASETRVAMGDADPTVVLNSSEEARGLVSLLARVRAGWPDHGPAYPNLPPRGTPQHAAAFSAHVLLHLQKQVGKLATLFEPLAHDAAAMDQRGRSGGGEEEVARQVAYTLIDALRLVPFVDVKAGIEALHRALVEWSSEQEQRQHEYGRRT